MRSLTLTLTLSLTLTLPPTRPYPDPNPDPNPTQVSDVHRTILYGGIFVYPAGKG